MHRSQSEILEKNFTAKFILGETQGRENQEKVPNGSTSRDTSIPDEC